MPEAVFGEAQARRAAESYERHFVPVIGTPVAADLVEAAALRPGDRVLDVACGTGAVTRLAAGRIGADGEVAGLDPNPAMLAVAREVVRSDAPLSWHEAPAEEIPLPDGSFDVALCGMGLQFFADRSAGLREIRRVLAPGGRLVASLPGPAPQPLQVLEETLAEHAGPEAGAFVALVFSLHDPDEVRALATDAGFDPVEVGSSRVAVRLPSPAEFLWQYVESTPLAAALAGLDEEERAALERDFVEGCEPFVEGSAMEGAVPMTTLIARVPSLER